MMSKRCRLALILVTVLALGLPATSSLAQERHTFPETGKTLGGGFKLFWERNGGLPVFGYPLSEEHDERSTDTGQVYTVQYFERQRFEYHPEQQGTPYEVQLGRLGVADAARHGLLQTEPFQRVAPDARAADAGCTYFADTGHFACHGFRAYWERHGLELGDPDLSFRESLALFGYPISEEFVDPATGLTVQYFERARFEYHPNNPEPHRILLGRLGADVHATRASLRPFEVWAVDQSGTAGTLYIYDGDDLINRTSQASPATIELSGAVAQFCEAQTGSAPVRAHMLLFNTAQTHAIIAYVASGHVVFLDAATRAPVSCIDVGVQAHAAFPSPDGRYVIVANQNGKLLQRINTDYQTNTFVLDDAATINLATCTTPSGAPCEAPALRPDNAPICPIIDSSSRLTFVTLRGGGLLVVDSTTTPMQIIAEYDQSTIRPNGCGGVETSGAMYINAGGGTASTPTRSDLYVFPLSEFPITGASAPNTPAPRTVYSKIEGPVDAHGMLLNRARAGQYLWVADRFANAMEVVDTTTNQLVNTFSLVSTHAPDPAPDLLDIAPSGDFAVASLRGPCPLTANLASINNAVGSTPGVGVIWVQQGGLSGELVAVAPISKPSEPFSCASVGGTPTLTERADVHAIAVRQR